MESLTYKREDDLEIFINDNGFVSLRSEPEGYDTQLITISPHRLPRVIEYLRKCAMELQGGKGEA